ncbi:MAG: Exodeoxyribonuclease 7 large subunit [Planctomycetota bacterium]|jgi:exodeoxyribonuclease VII large subunit
MQPDELPVISVTELVTAMKEVLETALPQCIVEGELSNCRRSPAGHWYLTLKDDHAEISAVIWKSTAQRLKFIPTDGLKVLATGSLSVYVTRGTCQFAISRLQPQGTGALELAFRQLQERLAAEGLFEASRKRPIPRIPRRIALVTSPTGAAVRDMIQVITRRWPPADIIIVPVRVQGEGAAEDIARALGIVHRIPGVDVVITGRGGGSLEDLWCFNTELVARAVAACKVPVISAVGHEIDVSISDLVADRRALTPSEAGELVVPSAAELRQSLRQTAERLRRCLLMKVDRCRLQLAALESRAVLQRPENLLLQRRQDCDLLGERLTRALQLLLERRRHQLAKLAATLQALSPLQVLARGYSLTQTATGHIVQTPSDVQPGDQIITRLKSGRIQSIVTAADLASHS